MLGDKIGEESGQITSTKVLSVDPSPLLEVSFQAQGQLLGIETTEVATYTSQMRADGTIYGEGHGVVMASDGSMATWKGSGVGKATGEGMAVSYRGALYYSTQSESLSRLNEIAAIFEFEVDAEGATSTVLWEWK
jgi:hypothetical protein